MADSPKDIVNAWIVRAAITVLGIAGGFIAHQIFFGNGGRTNANGTPTGWTPEQERDFLEMPHEHKNLMIIDDSILQKVERIEERQKHLR